MIGTRLGKITHAEFGLGGYQDVCIGIHISMMGDGWGTSTTSSSWDPNLRKSGEWTEEERNARYGEIVRYISDLLRDAKCNSVSELRGKPIEATFEGQTLKSWRILKEVL
jgi:hypothetical protein